MLYASSLNILISTDARHASCIRLYGLLTSLVLLLLQFVVTGNAAPCNRKGYIRSPAQMGLLPA